MPPCVSTLARKNDNKLIPSHVVFILCFVRWTSLTMIPGILAAVSADHVSSCPLMRINRYLRQWPGWLREYDTSDHSGVPAQTCKRCPLLREGIFSSQKKSPSALCYNGFLKCENILYSQCQTSSNIAGLSGPAPPFWQSLTPAPLSWHRENWCH